MTAKEYLSQIQKYRRTMKSLEEQAEALRVELAGLKAIEYDRDKIQVSPTNKIEELMPKLLEIEERYGTMIFKYHTAILIREKQINDMKREDYAEILRLRYIKTGEDGKRMTLEEIAVRTGRSFDRVRHLHGEALAAFGRKYL